MKEPKEIEITLKFDDPGLTDQQKQYLAEALRSEVVAVLSARHQGLVANAPQVHLC
jgi:hypothetical protein